MDKVNSPKVTISFPVYNSAPYVERALQSVINQNYSNLEILIIDDFGNDGSLQQVKEILKSFNGDYRIISFGENKRQGFGRNYSIENASGKYLFFMDSDDRLSLDAISVLVDVCENYNADVGIASFSKEDTNGITQGITYSNLNQLKGEYCLFECMYSDNILISSYMWNKLYRLSFLKDKNIYCEHPYIEDDLFSFKVMLKAMSCCLIPNVTYFYNTENLNSTTKVSMHAKEMSFQTARIHAEIVFTKFSYIINLPKSIMREKLLMDVLGTGIFHLYSIKKSSKINDDDKVKMSNLILTEIPEIKFYFSKYFTFKEHFKLFYYSIISKTPTWLIKFFVNLFNHSWYKISHKIN